jgi:dolichyl-phosphate-mannose-protein mannosyltransferase
MTKQRVFICLIGIMLFATFLRTWRLGVPKTYNFDEVHYVPPAKIMLGMEPHPGLAAWSYIPVIAKTPDINFSHPPLGKMIMGVGIKVFGDHPIGWRIMSVLFGIISVGCMFLLARQLLKDDVYALLCTFLLCCDFLHIVQSRIAMLDIFLITFCQMAMYFSLRFAQGIGRNSVNIGLAALFLCLAGSVKAPAVNAAIACAAIILFFRKDSWKYRIAASGSLVGLSALLYTAWFPYFASHGYSFTEWIMYYVESARQVTGPLSTHRYGSQPAQWLFNGKPIWYAYEHSGNYRYGVIGFGNPAIWLLSIPAFAVVLGRFTQTRENVDGILLTMVLSSYVPLIFMLWNRQGFIYHMGIVEVPLVMMVARAASIYPQKENFRRELIALTSIALVFFSPVLLYLPMPVEWYNWIAKLVGV